MLNLSLPNKGANHAFHNDKNEARDDKAAANLASSRTIAFWTKHLADKKIEENG